MPMRFFRWYRPLGSTTGYNLPSLGDDEVQGERALWLCSLSLSPLARWG
jgi:hypothetical protein